MRNILRGRGLALVLLIGSAPALADEDPAAIVARARAVEAAQHQALVGKSFEFASQGVIKDGKTPHPLQTWRRIEISAEGPKLIWLRGLLDGQPIDEDGLREKLSGRKKKEIKTGADVLLCVLTPLTDAEVTYLGPSENGGARLNVVPHHSDKVLSAVVEVDAAGRKRSATPRLGGEQFKRADKVEFVMRFSDDGAPLDFHSYTHGHFLWWEKSLEMSGHRVP
jgi:hypothetical protein